MTTPASPAAPRFAAVAVLFPQVAGVYHYHIPPDLGDVRVGQLVQVPFGPQDRPMQGVVLELLDQADVETTKPIHAIVDPEAVLTPAQIALARRLAQETLCSLAEALAPMLPPGVVQLSDTEYRLTPQGQAALAEQDLAPVARRLYTWLARGPRRGRALQRALPAGLAWEPVLQAWRRKGWVQARPVLPSPRARPAHARFVRLAVSDEVARAWLDRPELGRKAEVRARRARVLTTLLDEAGPVSWAWLEAATGARPQDLTALARHGLVAVLRRHRWRDPLVGRVNEPAEPEAPPRLTRDQARAWEAIQDAWQAVQQGASVPPLLLHGVTGSGKTELYLRAVGLALAQGRQALVLVPEISLTPQMVQRFVRRYPGQVGLLHSRLSLGQRYDTWRRARRGEIRVLIGPRSALYAALPDLGLIVVDECHSETYYPQEQPPFVHAREAARWYGELTGSLVLWGSATPEVQTMYRARVEGWPVLRLPRRVRVALQVEEHAAKDGTQALEAPEAVRGETAYSQPAQAQRDATSAEQTKPGTGARPAPAHPHIVLRFRVASPATPAEPSASEALAVTPLPGVAWPRASTWAGEGLPSVQVVDMRAELRLGETSIFSRALRAALAETLARGEQAILFLNRRGYAGHVFCRTCGFILRCPRCHVPLTYHQREGVLRCHHCGYQRRMPRRCPRCGSSRIAAFGTGTERVEAEVRRWFPHARTLRWDADTARTRDAAELLLQRFAHGQADVLIGTQMIAKGLDLPRVTLVGVVLADVGLGLPDYRASERVFQTLVQVAGRAGRADRPGRVVFQTYLPEHPAIRAAAAQDYEAFWRAELEARRALGYPPWSRLVRLLYRHPDPEHAAREAQRMARQIAAWRKEARAWSTDIIGPAPAFFARLRGYARWHILLRGPDPVRWLRGRSFPPGWRVYVDPVSLL
ncbi:MAG: primosomal protein N' [Chloroflexi bacterium]|nr:primosomal protein N' [Chloroflexota bacterium]